MDYEKMGLRIRKQRKEKGLTMEQLAEMIDVSYQNSSKEKVNKNAKIKLECV